MCTLYWGRKNLAFRDMVWTLCSAAFVNEREQRGEEHLELLWSRAQLCFSHDLHGGSRARAVLIYMRPFTLYRGLVDIEWCETVCQLDSGRRSWYEGEGFVWICGVHISRRREAGVDITVKDTGYNIWVSLENCAHHDFERRCWGTGLTRSFPWWIM